MTLTVEDGTGLSGADALVSLAYWKAYGDSNGWDYSSYDDDDQIEPAIRRGSKHISNAFIYEGLRNTRAQAFAFPRYGMYDLDSHPIPSDEVPTEVEQATAEAAWRELVTPDSLAPDVTLSARVKRTKVGVLEKEFADIGTSRDAARPDVKIIRDLLRGILVSSGNSVQLVRS